MSIKIESAKYINQGTKDIVSGFIRITQSSLSQENSFYNIPELMYVIILIFYYDEYFAFHQTL